MKVIRANAYKYPIYKMCKLLGISRSSYYACQESQIKTDPIESLVVKLFCENRRVYGTRKLKVELAKLGQRVSRRRISRIMKQYGLTSAYTVKKYRVYKDAVNTQNHPNLVNREFDGKKQYEVMISDLTYVRIGSKWGYICILLDLSNREIIGYSCGEHKDAQLVYHAFSSVKTNLSRFGIFHTDRGSEFNNYRIDDLLNAFHIHRSLSAKGCPYDNAVAEAQFKVIKTEFVRSRRFENLAHLQTELAAYVYWFNHKRIHGSLGYKTPVQARALLL